MGEVELTVRQGDEVIAGHGQPNMWAACVCAVLTLDALAIMQTPAEADIEIQQCELKRAVWDVLLPSVWIDGTELVSEFMDHFATVIQRCHQDPFGWMMHLNSEQNRTHC